MKPIRTSIARGMALVAVLALDLAAFRAALSEPYGEIGLFGDATTLFEMAVMFGPIALVAQLGFARSILGGRSHRAFWIGLTASALGVVPLLLWIGLADVPIASALWMGYLGGFEILVGKFPFLASAIASNQAIHGIVLACYQMLPQLVVALLGGVGVSLIIRVTGRKSVIPSGANSPNLALQRTPPVATVSGTVEGRSGGRVR